MFSKSFPYHSSSYLLLSVSIALDQTVQVACENIATRKLGRFSREKFDSLIQEQQSTHRDARLQLKRMKQLPGCICTSIKMLSFYQQTCSQSFPTLWHSLQAAARLKWFPEKFQVIKKLTSVVLHHNSIEKIESDTFKDLSSLEQLSLGEKIPTNNCRIQLMIIFLSAVTTE